MWPRRLGDNATERLRARPAPQSPVSYSVFGADDDVHVQLVKPSHVLWQEWWAWFACFLLGPLSL